MRALALAPDGVHATTRDVAAYFEVSESTVHNLLARHREELETNGPRVLRGADLHEFVTLNKRVSKGDALSYPQGQRRLAVYTRRTVLNVAMLLRDSEVARRVRAYLLDVEATATPVSGALEPRAGYELFRASRRPRADRPVLAWKRPPPGPATTWCRGPGVGRNRQGPTARPPR